MAEAGADPLGLVHDLRNPLAIVEGFSAALARDRGELTGEQRTEYAARIHAAAEEMRSLLDGDQAARGTSARAPK
jgi:signal transduction histidine kinase